MPSIERVTITLPGDLVREIDRRESNRSRFVAEAIRRELIRRRRAELRESVDNPHPESAALADQGLDDWSRRLPEEDTQGLLAPRAGKLVRWVPGKGWQERRK